MAGKLKRKFKSQSKKRSHTKRVEKRKSLRGSTTKVAKTEATTEQEDQSEFMQMVREAQQQQPQKIAGTGLRTTATGTGAAAAPTKKTHAPMTRKQAKRKSKMQVMGAAVADRRVSRVEDKLFRVKYRAQIRNSELKN